MKSATVEVMPDLEDGVPHNNEDKKKHKKYVLKTIQKQRLDK